MHFRTLAVAATLLMAFAVAGCTSKSSTTSAASATVTAKVSGFLPVEVTVKVGGKVKWTSSDAPHDETPDGSTTSWSPGGVGGVAQGQSYERTFDTAGDFAYFCQAHGKAAMHGIVHVKA